MTTYTVIIRRHDGTGDPHVVGAGLSERKADRVAGGVFINLNSEDYFVEVEEDS